MRSVLESEYDLYTSGLINSVTYLHQLVYKQTAAGTRPRKTSFTQKPGTQPPNETMNPTRQSTYRQHYSLGPTNESTIGAIALGRPEL